MIRFVDLTPFYWPKDAEGIPLCAFLNTTDNRFLTTDDNEQIFHSVEEIRRHKQVNRILRLLPPNFFGEEK